MRLLLWLRGWRRDLDGWLVRARLASHPATLDPIVGFVEEACIAARTPSDALLIDRAARNAAKGSPGDE